ncbi:Na(+)/H(+) exchange regulatory cofactor NHE-RF1a [Salarias fasciatus]|uniref:Na(+)/H(+) exchange regulatory cofactor NHE-RF n=1 Tax=Salarias fasciatus TaxID=181472 RepID=A0A672GYS0_SALFA|nr:Na(+)/H(+) exchange regulatory cofactor NHE-RF1-like [Salarias fasciatus]XP_029954276.1 Na(+)/H(+) exchange regulatory cofactor NHE-RF1-like [Salarias fasciatus]
MPNLRPRLCVMEKGPSGYGFHLHGEKGKNGQFIRLVEDDTPASKAGLLAGDRLMFVNGDNVEGESHQQVVSRIRATTGALALIVVDEETGELLKRHNLQCREEFVEDGIPVPGADSDSDRGDTRSNGDSDRGDTQSNADSDRGDTQSNGSEARQENGDTSSERSARLSVSSSTKDDGPRPRLCHLKKGSTGYGFNLHSEKTRPGQFIRAVDDDSPAQRAGLRAQDKIIQVNGVSVVGMQHSEVVAAIKAGGDETRLLVVDPETEEFFKRCNIQPGEEHVSGPLPEPVSARASEDEEPKVKSKLSSSASSASSNSSLPPQTEKEPEFPDGLGLGVSLAEARERAQKKREARKAPKMDWSKRNELFSNL